MATDFRTREGRQKILEGLWLIGIEPSQLNVSPDLEGNAFLDALHRNGVNDTFVGRAIAGVDWRKGDTTLSQNVMGLLRASGYRQDEIDRFYNEVVQRGAGNDPARLMQGLTTLFGDRSAGAMIYKASGGQAPQGAIWNPFRTDGPPPTADTRYGGGGVLATNLPAGMSSVEPANRLAQPGVPNPTVRSTATSGVPNRPGTTQPGLQARQPGPVGRPPGATAGAGGGGMGGGGGGTMDTTPALGENASWDQIQAYVRKHYAQYAWMLDVPDIRDVMEQAAKKGWEADEVWGAFTASNWYKTTEPKARQWAELRGTDPAAAKDQIKDQKTVLRNQALGLGINVPPGELDRLAEESLKFGWTDNELRAALGQFYSYDAKNLLGSAQATAAHIKQAAKDWLVPIDEATVGKWTEQVIRGEMTTDYFDTYLAQQAQSLYPQLAEPISRGVAPGQWMQPYVSIAAQALEMDPEQIDLRDTKWLRAINQVDDKGGRKAMTLYDWENLIKTDETYGWDKTRQGRDHGAGLARSIAAQFGFATGGGL